MDVDREAEEADKIREYLSASGDERDVRFSFLNVSIVSRFLFIRIARVIVCTVSVVFRFSKTRSQKANDRLLMIRAPRHVSLFAESICISRFNFKVPDEIDEEEFEESPSAGLVYERTEFNGETGFFWTEEDPVEASEVGMADRATYLVFIPVNFQGRG